MPIVIAGKSMPTMTDPEAEASTQSNKQALSLVKSYDSEPPFLESLETVKQESQFQFLHRQVSRRRTQLEQSIGWSRYTHHLAQIGPLVFAALITIVAGLKSVFSLNLASNLVLALGALSMSLAAWGAFSSPRESWLLNSEICGRLRELQFKLEFAERAPDFHEKEVDVASEGFTEYQSILTELNDRYQQLRRKARSC